VEDAHTWLLVASIPTAHRSVTYCVKGQYLYLLGAGIGPVLNRYDADTDSWTRMKNIDTPRRMSMFVWTDRIYVASNQGSEQTKIQESTMNVFLDGGNLGDVTPVPCDPSNKSLAWNRRTIPMTMNQSTTTTRMRMRTSRCCGSNVTLRTQSCHLRIPLAPKKDVEKTTTVLPKKKSAKPHERPKNKKQTS
jgi:hypothetical protein